MAMTARIYCNAVFGGLGGLLGWLMFGVFGNSPPAGTNQWLLGGALIGGCVGYFVVSVEAIRDRALVRFCRLASYGVVLGAAGGALGMAIGEWAHFQLVDHLSVRRTDGGPTSPLLSAMLARGLGWMVLGLSVGLGEGVASRSFGKLAYGILGGGLGGFVGGSLFGLIYLKTLSAGGSALEFSGVTAGALGLVILGATIGALSALVQEVFQPASIKVLRGWQEGREYPLIKSDNWLGRDEHADIALFRDMRIEKRHVLIHRTGDRFVLRNQDAPPEQTLVNDAPVSDSRDLADGDRIQLGHVVLRFQMRTARVRRKQAG
jgi:hypothetical protein